MIKKKIGAVLGCLMMLAVALPLATAHLSTTGSFTSGVHTPLDLDFCRSEGRGSTGYTLEEAAAAYATDAVLDTFDAGCEGNDGVSGSYVGPAGAYLDSPTLFGAANPVVLAAALCDAEVLGTGSSPSPQDEQWVDNEEGGLVPDGTFDDGGFGGACHTQDHYEQEGYDTPGCSGSASAKDAVSGTDVFIGLACDWKSTGGGQDFATCVTNEVLGWDLNDPTSIVGGIATCAEYLVNGGGNGASFQACGGEGVADDVHYGSGNSGVEFPNYADDETDPLAVGCDGNDESAVVFVFEYVSEAGPEVIPATVGWVDTSPPTPPECGNNLDDDGDGKPDEADPGCHSLPFGLYNPNDPSEDSEGAQTNTCEDMIDNDADGFADWEDPDCWDAFGNYTPDANTE